MRQLCLVRRNLSVLKILLPLSNERQKDKKTKEQKDKKTNETDLSC